MRVKCGIICEYNPFHNGHAYHIKETKKYAENIVCVMSGDFVQRAEPAIFDKCNRAEAALKSGASAVIELPTVFATAGARQFAFGAIEILSKIKGLNYVSFGIESCSSKIIKAIANIQADESDDFKNELNQHLRSGLSYAQSYSNATKSKLIELGFDTAQINSGLSGPNNVLAAEYLKAMHKKNLKIKPIFINRCDKGYNSESLTPPYASASAIRSLIKSGADYTPFVPKTFNNIVNEDLYNAIIRYLLLKLVLKNLTNTSQGVLDQKIVNAAKKHATVEEIICSIKSKAFTYAHIKRRVLQLSLGIDETLLNHNGTFFTRLLGVRESFRPYLADLPPTTLIKAADKNCIDDEILKIDKLASDLYAVITNQSSSRFFQRLITI